MSALRALALGLVALLAAGALALVALWHHRPGLPAYAAHAHPADVPERAVTATWFGTTAVLLRDGGHGVFIDPFFTRPPGLWPVLRNATIAPDEAAIARWLGKAGVVRLDAVVVSHSHYDHAMDAAVVARLTGATLLGSPSTANVGRGGGLAPDRIVVAAPGAPIDAGPFRITLVESRHAGASGGRPTGDIEAPLVPPARYLDYRQGGTYSILVEHPQGAVLHHGSAGFVPGALAGRRADVVFLGVAIIDDLPAYLAEVVTAVGARRVIPVHWDDFTRPLDAPLEPMPVLVDLDAFFAGVAAHPGLEARTLTLAQPVAPFVR